MTILKISTHTSRVGCDRIFLTFQYITDISTHTSRVGCDSKYSDYGGYSYRFLLTHPVWDVTFWSVPVNSRQKDFYSHIPCGMWRETDLHDSAFGKFLLTHPVWDVTILQRLMLCLFQIFLLTHPVWDVTNFLRSYRAALDFYSHIPCGMWHGGPLQSYWRNTISTHTSRVGCDETRARKRSNIYNFYSHIPCGMWRESRWR